MNLVGQTMLVEERSECLDAFDLLALPIPKIDAGVANQGLEEGHRLFLQLVR